MKSSIPFVLGIGTGVLAMLLIRRIEERLEEEDELELASRMRAYIRELEDRAEKMTSEVQKAVSPKAARKKRTG